jgi:hypothetical protein
LIFNNRLFYKYISLGIDGFGGLGDDKKDEKKERNGQRRKTSGFVVSVVYSGGVMMIFLPSSRSNELIFLPSGIKVIDGISPLE